MLLDGLLASRELADELGARDLVYDETRRGGAPAGELGTIEVPVSLDGRREDDDLLRRGLVLYRVRPADGVAYDLCLGPEARQEQG